MRFAMHFDRTGRLAAEQAAPAEAELTIAANARASLMALEIASGDASAYPER